MSLEQALDALIGSEAFERLLLERARPVVAHADAGEDALVAALARALGAPVLLVAPGPREAERLARGARAWLGDDGAALLPSWEALPYEGISPSPEVSARRADAVRRLRAAKGAFVLVAPALAAMQGLVPTLGEIPPVELVKGIELPPDDLAERLVALGYAHGRGRTSRRVRRPRRRPRRLPRDRRARCASSTGATRSSRSASSCRRRSCRPGPSSASRCRPCASSSPTTRWPNARERGRPATSTGSATGSSGSRRACTPRGSSRSPPAVRPDAGPRRAAAGGLVGRGLGGPPHLRPRASGVRGRRGARRGLELARPARGPRPGEALEGPVRLELTGFTEGIDTGWRDGARRRATRPSSRGGPRSSPSAGTACCSRRAATARWNASASSSRCHGPSRSRPSCRPASCSPPASSRWRPRRTCSGPGATRATPRGSRRVAATRSPRSSRSATSRCTACTGSPATWACNVARSAVPNATTWCSSTPRATGSRSPPTRSGWWRSTSAARRLACRDWARATGRGRPGASSAP